MMSTHLILVLVPSSVEAIIHVLDQRMDWHGCSLIITDLVPWPQRHSRGPQFSVDRLALEVAASQA